MRAQYNMETDESYNRMLISILNAADIASKERDLTAMELFALCDTYELLASRDKDLARGSYQVQYDRACRALGDTGATTLGEEVMSPSLSPG